MTTSYSNSGGTGDRTSSITTTTNIELGAGAITALVDGSFSDSLWWLFKGTAGYVLFDFGAAASKIIDEFKWYQSTSASHGTWDFQGSNDNSNWTTLKAGLTLGGATTSTYSFTNTDGYRYYRLNFVSGTRNSGPFLREIEFKIADATGNFVHSQAVVVN